MSSKDIYSISLCPPLSPPKLLFFRSPHQAIRIIAATELVFLCFEVVIGFGGIMNQRLYLGIYLLFAFFNLTGAVTLLRGINLTSSISFMVYLVWKPIQILGLVGVTVWEGFTLEQRVEAAFLGSAKSKHFPVKGESEVRSAAASLAHGYFTAEAVLTSIYIGLELFFWFNAYIIWKWIEYRDMERALERHYRLGYPIAPLDSTLSTPELLQREYQISSPSDEASYDNNEYLRSTYLAPPPPVPRNSYAVPFKYRPIPKTLESVDISDTAF